MNVVHILLGSRVDPASILGVAISVIFGSQVFVTEEDILRRLTLGFNELNFNTSEQNK